MAAPNETARTPDDEADPSSQLPTSVLASILSRLPLRPALRCAIVSKPWLAAQRELLACAASLDFGPDFARGLSPEHYSSAVSRLIALHQARTLGSLRIFFYPGRNRLLQHRVKDWVEFASSKGVRELDIDLLGAAPPRGDEPLALCRLPGEAFHSTCLTLLSLSMCCLSSSLDPVQLPSLRTLSLRQVNVTDDTVAAFLLNCPLLVELKLIQCFQLRSIKILCPPQLSSLEIVDCLLAKSVEIDAPMLKSLCLSGYLSKIVLRSTLSLIDVYVNSILSLTDPSLQEWGFLGAFTHVTTLTLCHSSCRHFRASIIRWMALLPLRFYGVKILRIIVEQTLPTFSELKLLLSGFLAKCIFPALESLLIESSQWRRRVAGNIGSFPN